MTLDVKDFYLNTDINVWEYMKMEINIIPEDYTTLFRSKVPTVQTFTSTLTSTYGYT